MEPSAVQFAQPQSVAQPATNLYAEMCARIVREQGQIIGIPLALEQASHVNGLQIDSTTFACTVTGDGTTVVNSLIEQYRDFFGHAAVEVCREATSQYVGQLPEGAMPSLLK